MNVDYPYHFDGRSRTASAVEDDHVRDMIEQALFTQPGERVNRPEFGSGLLQLVFEPLADELAAAVQFMVQGAIQQWLGDVIATEEVRVEAEGSTLRVVVAYSLRQTGERRTDSFELPRSGA